MLADEHPHRALGPVLAWARGRDLATVHLVVDDPAAAGALARRAAAFADPPPVWLARGPRMERAVAAAHPVDAPVDARLTPFFHLLVAAGVDPVVEHGVLTGEVLGLEVARVVTDGDEPRLEVGVGRFDREAFATMNPDVAPPEALARVVAEVRRHRHASAPPHPLNRLAPERWLRARVVAQPGRVGADHLAPVAPSRARTDLRSRSVAPAVGTDVEGTTVVVACSTGVDLDLVPEAADVRDRDAPDARLVLALPQRDDLPVTRALAAALARPAEVVPLAVVGHRFANEDDG